MSKGVSGKITYKPYDQRRTRLVPPSAGELIPANRLSRLVNGVVGQMRMEPLLGKRHAWRRWWGEGG
jgi:hypothetical protein